MSEFIVLTLVAFIVLYSYVTQSSVVTLCNYFPLTFTYEERREVI